MSSDAVFDNLCQRLSVAVSHFWTTRNKQGQKQGSEGGRRDAGTRSAVTGGKQMDGFVELVRDLVVEAGIPEPSVFCNRKCEIPGYFRPSKNWDLLVVVDKILLATIEFKSQVGSFGNNYNNRTEEAIGSATDLQTAYREGAFSPEERPWVGYLMLLQETPKSMSPCRVIEPHFQVFDEFRGASYAKRYELLLTKLVRERLYDSTCFLLSESISGKDGSYNEPSQELSFRNFATSLLARCIAHVKGRGGYT